MRVGLDAGAHTKSNIEKDANRSFYIHSFNFRLHGAVSGSQAAA